MENNKLILHPSRNFLDARNPSSPFQYKMSMAIQTHKIIYKRRGFDVWLRDGYKKLFNNLLKKFL